jgi:ketosteroid isomerase-like protein
MKSRRPVNSDVRLLNISKKESPMKQILVLTAIVLSVASSVWGQGTGDRSRDKKTEQELRAWVRAWDEANVKGDASVIGQLLADEFVFVGGPTKREYIASLKIKSPDSYVESAISENVTVQVYGNTAVVTGLDTITGKNKGQAYTNRWLFMDVWIKKSGRWQCVKTYSTLAKN